MHKKKIKKTNLTAVMLTVLACGCLVTKNRADLSGSASDLKVPADYIQYDENRNAYYDEQGERRTGKFYAEPNFMLGDMDSNGVVNSGDASKVLEVCAIAGAGEFDVESTIANENNIDEEDALTLVDINQDGVIDARDASEILSYAAELGSGYEITTLGAAYYYADENGFLQAGFINDEQTGQVYYAWQDYTLAAGWLDLDGKRYYCSQDGVIQTGWEVIDGEQYYFSPEDYTMQTGTLCFAGITYYLDENGMLTGKEYAIDDEIRQMLDDAERNPGQREIKVYDRQYPEKGEPVEFTIRLSDRDYQIIEDFASVHFTPEMTLSECLYETWWWIHANVDYAYAGEKWNAICNLSYPDAIFNHQSGQCVQYNGAMAAVLAYYGYDVYMVKGWTNPPKNTTQHYWTEVMINDIRYYIETGNQGKNGDSWKYFFVDADTVRYTQKTTTETSAS